MTTYDRCVSIRNTPKVNRPTHDVETDNAVRVYSDAPDTIALQLRGRCGRGSYGNGKPVATFTHVSLTRNELTAVRDAITEALAARGWERL
jgi:hypothetical protein